MEKMKTKYDEDTRLVSLCEIDGQNDCNTPQYGLYALFTQCSRENGAGVHDGGAVFRWLRISCTLTSRKTARLEALDGSHEEADDECSEGHVRFTEWL